MKSLARSPAFALIALLAFARPAQLDASNAAGEPLPLPFESRLTQATVALVLSDAEVTVGIDDSRDPVLTVEALSQSATRDSGFATVVHSAEGLTVEPADVEGSRLRISVVLRSDQRLELRGRDLGLTLEEPLTSQSAADLELAKVGVEAAEAEGPPARYLLRLEASQVDLVGLADVQIATVSSDIWIRDSHGRLQLEVRAGSAEIRGHQGQVDAVSASAELVFLDSRGQIAAEVGAGSLRFEGGGGALDVVARESDVALTGWSGSLTFAGRGGRFAARDAARFPGAWQLEGTDLTVSLERIGGALTAKLQGGIFNLDELAGTLQLEGRDGLEVEASHLAGNVDLTLYSGVEARLTDLTQTLVAAVEDSSLRIDQVTHLALRSTRSRVEAAGVGRLRRLEAADSWLDLDLTDLAQNPILVLTGGGDATVWLRTPCIVTVQSDDPERAGQIRVTSCDLRMPGQPLVSARNRLIHGHRRPTVLTLALDEGQRVVVEGRTTD